VRIRIARTDAPAVQARYLLRNGETNSGASRTMFAGITESIKRTKYFF
jgi:hypothetical protein